MIRSPVSGVVLARQVDPGQTVASSFNTPTLFVIATHDTVASTAVAVAAFDRSPEPKHLEMVEGHHFTPYTGDALEQVARAALAFYLSTL